MDRELYCQINQSSVTLLDLINIVKLFLDVEVTEDLYILGSNRFSIGMIYFERRTAKRLLIKILNET